MTITCLALSFLAAAFLTQLSMGYCLSGCFLLKQQDKILLIFLMGMNFLSVPPHTANLLCEMTLMTPLKIEDTIAWVRQIIQLCSY